MKDFKDKILRIFVNELNDFTTMTGLYMDSNEDFLIITNTYTHRIQYVSKYYIRYIEIVRSVKDEEL